MRVCSGLRLGHGGCCAVRPAKRSSHNRHYTRERPHTNGRHIAHARLGLCARDRWRARAAIASGCAVQGDRGHARNGAREMRRSMIGHVLAQASSKGEGSTWNAMEHYGTTHAGQRRGAAPMHMGARGQPPRRGPWDGGGARTASVHAVGSGSCRAKPAAHTAEAGSSSPRKGVERTSGAAECARRRDDRGNVQELHR